ncbi:hypothetical protein L6452_06995 [Arctium lappa]|uniref:Uncharacterized protein n=1 Tax=Arctium lappa TaxID=4217 RepID=A0ACB9EKC5_ARCLA|nr:hypothetical protein L6452_06995 [Arctium lappa]
MVNELFSDGKIIPTQIKKHPPPPQSPWLNQNQSLLMEEEQQNSSKSFWIFKRSSSCDNGYTRSLRPIPLLSRSNYVGSSISTKRPSSSKEGFTHKHHHNFQKPSLGKTRSSKLHKPPPMTMLLPSSDELIFELESSFSSPSVS